ncbi:hypothetical protein RLEG12_05585 (plasmid) [Rhizobium leguminosarum bv. trifolii CB782]|nr:hypothetical protein [Rhizobium hidalgonense]AHG48390.1 hypothetical protein RLEG12_05585 [Rhizobium leguminosarum bv. trifolii CB782]
MRYISFRTSGKARATRTGPAAAAGYTPAFHADNWNMATATRGA